MLKGLNNTPSFNGRVTIKEGKKTIESKETSASTDNNFVSDLARQFGNRMQKIEVIKDPRLQRFENQLAAKIKGITVNVDGYKDLAKKENIKRLDITMTEGNHVVNWRIDPDELSKETVSHLVYQLAGRIRESAPPVDVVKRFFNKLYGG
ncbi:MAG: hypothetical protein AB7V50_09595 [Vampirovibrionia bacterium]